MNQAEATRRTAVDSDGWEYDLDTGEVLGPADPPEPFAITSDDQAEDVLKARSVIEGEVLALDARAAAQADHFRAMRREKERELAKWDWFYRNALVAYARTKLTGHGKTARWSYGSVAVRAVPPHTSVIDDAAAVAWVKEWNPRAVTTAVRETVTLKAIRAILDDVRAATGEEPSLPFLATTEAREECTITTGIEPRKETR